MKEENKEISWTMESGTTTIGKKRVKTILISKEYENPRRSESEIQYIGKEGFFIVNELVDESHNIEIHLMPRTYKYRGELRERLDYCIKDKDGSRIWHNDLHISKIRKKSRCTKYNLGDYVKYFDGGVGKIQLIYIDNASYIVYFPKEKLERQIDRDEDLEVISEDEYMAYLI